MPRCYTEAMDDRTKTLAAITVIVGVLLFVALVVGVMVSGSKVLSPVPDDNAIRIIFVSPSPLPTISPTPLTSPTATPKAKK